MSTPTTTRPAEQPAAREQPDRVRRRRVTPAIIALGVALIVVAAGGIGFFLTQSRQTVTVLVAAGSIAQGQVITDTDLRTTNLNADNGVPTIRASSRGTTVGLRAVTALPAGSVLSPDDVTGAAQPANGESVVGVTVTPAQMPSEELRPGDRVRVVDTPGDGATTAVTADPFSSGATVVTTQQLPDTGQVVIDVLVADADAPRLAARVSTAKIAVVLDSRER